jgi:putative PIN family toxin of toxin-antitoxin system
VKLVVDTNVFISGVFFSGTPHNILDAWRHGQFTLVLSPEILAEYQATGDELSIKFPGVDLNPWLELVAALAVVVKAPPLPTQVCTDPDDDMFLACALAANAKLITTGDKALLATSGYRGITVLTPRHLLDQYLK